MTDHDKEVERVLADLKECIRLSNLVIGGTPRATIDQIYRECNYSSVVPAERTTENGDSADPGATT